jgi:5-methylcytosine-specific restriction enzyme subunit McrC
VSDNAPSVGEPLPNGRILYRLESRKSLELALADVTIGGNIEVYPHVEEKGLLFLQFRRRRLVVAAGPFIGLIPLTPRISIEVRPKLPVSNLSRVLDAAHRSLSTLPGTDRLYLTDNLASASVLEFLAVNLHDAMRPVIEGGFLKAYHSRSEVGSHPRGRIEVAGTLRAWGRGQHHMVQTSFFEQTSDIPVNRLLKSALQLVLQRLQPTNSARRELIKSANLTYGNLPSVIGHIKERDRAIAQAGVKERNIPEQKSYYYRAIEIALMILSDTGISLQSSGNDVSLASFIVNFEELFEEYLRRVLQAGAPVDFYVKDGNKEGKRYLFDEKKGQPAQPDIVVSAGKSRIVVAEVKYKEKPSRDDINQAITYAVCYRTRNAVLVHQCSAEKTSGLYRIGTINGIELDGYAFNLGTIEIEKEEELFRNAIFGLFEPAIVGAAAA